ncbi:MAG TPA: hypothetical protein H9772_00310 [Candidatus Oscillibacter pullicola]|nr:hypothetical protein [Candidatus Oscillibacter pullicola]
MIDKRMYRETFSQLRASDQAKQEVLQKMQEMKQRKRMPRVLRGAALAAAMMMALAVTAGAVNVAMDGALFRQFTIVWTSGDQYLARDDQGNAVSITLVDGDVVTEEDGRLILHVDGEDIDITDRLEADGVYTYAYDMEVVHEDGSRETRTVSIQVTGSPEQWTATQDNGDGMVYETSGGSGAAGNSVTVPEPVEDGSGTLPEASEDSASPKQAQEVTPAE